MREPQLLLRECRSCVTVVGTSDSSPKEMVKWLPCAGSEKRNSYRFSLLQRCTGVGYHILHLEYTKRIVFETSRLGVEFIIAHPSQHGKKNWFKSRGAPYTQWLGSSGIMNIS